MRPGLRPLMRHLHILLGEIMILVRTNSRREILEVRHERGRKIPAGSWALAIPFVAMALAGCGGASSASAPTPTESLIQQASHSCRLDHSIYATLGDSGYTITLEGGTTSTSTADYGRVTGGLTTKQIVCVLSALSVRDSVVSQMDATRAVDGMQKASWDNISASWTYHPDHGLRVILTESK